MTTSIGKAFFFAPVAFLCGCLTIGEVGMADLSGRVFVEWDRQDEFIYRRTDRPLTFKPSFMTEPIVPEDMYTDGGSVPRVFWSIPGLSPWGLGPAYIIHDWIFEVHRCGREAPPHVKAITFEDSALILAEVGRALIDANLIQDDMLPLIVAAVRSRFARATWDRPPTGDDCDPPPPRAEGFGPAAAAPQVLVDFEIPPPVR